MNHPTPYALLREANGLQPSPAADSPGLAPWTDLHTLAARWQDLRQPPPDADSPAPLQEADVKADVKADAPAGNPRMRTPAPMHPSIAYPTGTQTYGAPAAAPRQRHAYYDAIIEQHKSAAEKAVFVPAELE
ncbi:MAG: hypothetical protein FWE77_05270 [Clostridia bacterium]|nr:hypothetical protein [Clostridia bacterium]